MADRRFETVPTRPQICIIPSGVNCVNETAGGSEIRHSLDHWNSLRSLNDAANRR